ncbi:MAG: efflux RND transporter periplasmic adaptor subunit [bacterium]
MSAGVRRGAIAAVVIVVLVVAGAVPRVRRAHALDRLAREDSLAGVRVTVALAHRATAAGDLALTGTVQALHETNVYARSNGYVRKWTADIGSKVRANQLLAVIETPDVDRQYDQAEADLTRARSTQALAKRNLDRWQRLEQDSAVSAQELDEHQSAYDDASANVSAARANVGRYASLKGYANVEAPFAGVVTARNIDVGMLVAPATTPGTRGLFTIAQTDTVRIMVSVPQAQVSAITIGQQADIVLPDGGRTVKGTVMRTSSSLDAAARTLTVEVDAPNKDNALLPGMFGEVHFHLSGGTPPVRVPSGALVFRPEGTQVAMVGPDDIVHFIKVTLGRDYGADVEVLADVPEGARLILNPSDDVVDGLKVHIIGNVESKDK